MTFNKKSFIITGAVVLLLLAISQVPPVALRLKTVGVSLNLLIPQGAWRPLELLTRAPILEEHQFQSQAGRTITTHVYVPKSRPRAPKTAMVIYVPLAGGGLNDPRLVNLAKTFANIGFVTAVPWRQEDQLIIGLKDVDDVVSTALFLINQQELNIDRLGLFGISYGAGPVIAAATDQRLRDKLHFIVSFNGYYDLLHMLDFILTGRYSYKNIEGVLEPDPYTREILNAALAYYNTDEETLRAGAEFETLRKVISPSHTVHQIETDFFIAHSTDDRVIPYTESMRLRDALISRVPVTFNLTTVFEHGTYKSLTLQNIRRHYLPSISVFYNFIFTLLAKHL